MCTGLSTPAEVSVGRAVGGKVPCGTSCMLLPISTRAPFMESHERATGCCGGLDEEYS